MTQDKPKHYEWIADGKPAAQPVPFDPELIYRIGPPMTEKLRAYFAWDAKDQKRLGRECQHFNGTHEEAEALAYRQIDRLGREIDRLDCEAEVKTHYMRGARLTSDDKTCT